MISGRVSRLRPDRPGQRVTAKRAEADLLHARDLARRQRQAVVVDHDQRAVALDDRALLGEIKRHDRHVLGRDIVPDVELGPIRQGKHPHRFALA